MQIPLEVTFRDTPPSEALEGWIREKAAQLERYSDRIVACRVAIEVPHRRHHQGNTYRVRIDLSLPGEEIVVGRDPEENHAHEDPYVAVRDAFRAARRRLEDVTAMQRGYVKPKSGARAEGRIARVFPDDGYGFIETPDRREIYFHENAVKRGSFDALEIGAVVSFVEGDDGEKGPQASAVFA